LNTQAQRFSAKTAEEAVLAAIEALGEDAVVVEAKRVKRGGMLGRFGGEHVEVIARPRRASGAVAPPRREEPRPAPAPSFQGSLRRALSSRKELERLAAEAREADTFVDLTDHGSGDDIDLRTDGEHRRGAEPPRASRLPARFTDDDLAPLPAPVAGEAPAAVLTLAAPPPVPAGIAVAANPAVIDLRSHAEQRTRAATLAPPPPPPPQQPVPTRSQSVIDRIATPDRTPVRWGRAELRAIGVPQPVLDELPKDDPVSDTVWSMALETAIWWTLRKHRPRTSLVVDGYGPEGAMALLEAVLEGHVIRYLHLGDRSVEANPRELAKAVRSCLPR
jgi:hypothetical protein